ncbi:hypothetical protein [uncultured Sphingorhabdus sp.]|uniref:hypothetical protein n=1 Tax=uncultured Sphingorhabdus sp. TaxID=1686106 RepID=UPI002633E594|nr:hypothetical protein [uncultured Sphingorhabdus sp.]
MIRVEPFQPSHLLDIEVQAAQRGDNYRLSLFELGKVQSARGMSFTARDSDSGRILICGGMAEVHANYACLWAVLAEGKRGNMQLITRRVRSFVQGLPHARVDATIHADFGAGIRWARLIGLRHETTLAEAMPDGGNALIFRRMN